jgi:uncharacterized membrane protein YjjB (DUF3815 family)
MIVLQQLVQILAAMLATLGLAILFQVPMKQWIPCCIAGGIGWFSSSILVHFGLPIVLSTFVATIVITFLARFLSALRGMPVSVFLLTGIFPLVPGVKIYLAATYAFSKNMALFGEAGMEAIMQSGAIVMGILIASAIPQGFYDRFIKKPLDAFSEGQSEAEESEAGQGEARET